MKETAVTSPELSKSRRNRKLPNLAAAASGILRAKYREIRYFGH